MPPAGLEPTFQQASGLRPTPYTARLLGPAQLLLEYIIIIIIIIITTTLYCEVQYFLL